MHGRTLEHWRHEHLFLGADHARNERRTWIVITLTATMMLGEIVGGMIFGSLALTADGWHMATHAGALTISALAYRYARRHAGDPRFAFGTGKLGELASFTSAIVLGLVALAIGYESLLRFMAPVAIAFDEAIAIAVLGLVINMASAWLLQDTGARGHAHHHGHRHHRDEVGRHVHHQPAHAGAPHGQDNNLRAAYLHVLADALTSVLAIVGLLAARFYGWTWMDPLMAVIGALVIGRWSFGLARDAGAVLLDVVPDRGTAERMRRVLEVNGDRVADLHLWQVGPGHHAAAIAIVSDQPRPPEHYKALLRRVPGLSHTTVEVHACPDARGPQHRAAA